MMEKTEKLRVIQHIRDKCNSGYAALLSGDIVDKREYTGAEYLTEGAIENILFDLKSEEDELNSDNGKLI